MLIVSCFTACIKNFYSWNDLFIMDIHSYSQHNICDIRCDKENIKGLNNYNVQLMFIQQLQVIRVGSNAKTTQKALPRATIIVFYWNIVVNLGLIQSYIQQNIQSFNNKSAKNIYTNSLVLQWGASKYLITNVLHEQFIFNYIIKFDCKASVKGMFLILIEGNSLPSTS